MGVLSSTRPLARQGRAVGNWRPVLLQHLWGRLAADMAADMESWARDRQRESRETEG